MTGRAALALVALAGCPPKTTSGPTIDKQTAPPPIACPTGTKAVGAAPPVGFVAWCQGILDGSGRVVKHGPEMTWHPDGSKSGLGQYDRDRRHGYWQTWYPDGSPKTQGSYEYGVAIGTWTEFHPGGSKKGEGEMQAGLAAGEWTWWHPNGQIETQGQMLDGGKDGVWVEYDEQGTAIARREYRGGRMIKHTVLAAPKP
jgi:hypothetical protein